MTTTKSKRRGPGRPRGPETVRLHVRIPAELEARVRAEATEGRSLVWMVCDLLERGLADRERERKRARRPRRS